MSRLFLLFHPFHTITLISLLGSILGAHYDISLISILSLLAFALAPTITLNRAL